MILNVEFVTVRTNCSNEDLVISATSAITAEHVHASAEVNFFFLLLGLNGGFRGSTTTAASSSAATASTAAADTSELGLTGSKKLVHVLTSQVGDQSGDLLFISLTTTSSDHLGHSGSIRRRVSANHAQ